MESTSDYFDNGFDEPENLQVKATAPAKLHPPSEEQLAIINAVSSADNITIDSVAGSGKTTTVLHIARHYPNRRILLLTYNNKLAKESRERAADLDNLMISTIHGYIYGQDISDDSAVIYSDSFDDYFDAPDHRLGRDDAELLQFLKSGRIVKSLGFDLVIIDEAQDLTPILYMVIRRILDAESPQIMIIGDTKQAIYQYAGADARFISMAHKLFQNGRKWQNLKLTTSYRITSQMAALVNCLSGENRITSPKDNGGVEYIIRDPKKIYDVVVELCEQYDYDEIFVLGPTVKDKFRSWQNELIEKLSKDKKIPIYAPSDMRQPDYEASLGKLVFSSFHQAKGLERKVVIVVGIDDGYYEWFGQIYERDELPNPVYVALTRATEKLIVIQRPDRRCIGRADIEDIKGICRVSGILAPRGTSRQKKSVHGVRDLAEKLPALEMMRLIDTYIDKQEIWPAGSALTFASTSVQPFRGKMLTEEVSDINGVVIPAVFEYQCTGSMTIHEELAGLLRATRPLLNVNSAEAMLDLGAQYLAERDRTFYRRRQITCHNWLTNSDIKDGVGRLGTVIEASEDVKNEVSVQCTMLREGRPYQEIIGFIDMIARPSEVLLSDPLFQSAGVELWEIKTTAELRSEDILQAAIYAEIYSIATGRPTSILLYNARTNQLMRISGRVQPEESIRPSILQDLICLKNHRGMKKQTDDEFLETLARGAESISVTCHICAALDIRAYVIFNNRKKRMRCLRLFEEYRASIGGGICSPEEYQKPDRELITIQSTNIIVRYEYDNAEEDVIEECYEALDYGRHPQFSIIDYKDLNSAADIRDLISRSKDWPAQKINTSAN